MNINTIGLETIFHLVGLDKKGKQIQKKKLRRGQVLAYLQTYHLHNSNRGLWQRLLLAKRAKQARAQSKASSRSISKMEETIYGGAGQTH